MAGQKALPYCAWVFDIDGTLLDSQAILRPRTMRALENLRASGALLLVATALPPRYARVKLAAIPDLCRRGIYLGGGLVIDEVGGFVHEVRLPAGVTAEILAILEAAAPELQILVQYGDTHHALRLPSLAEERESWGYAPDALLPYEDSASAPCTKIIAWHEEVDLAAAYEALQRTLGDRARFYLTDAGHAIQATAVEATKGQGLVRLLAHLQVDPAHAIVFGDGPPDVDMFAQVGTSVAMANATPEVRAAATWVTATHDEDGVALAIERLLRDQAQATV